MITAGDPLRQLSHVVARQLFAQLWLTDEDNLQQLLLGRLEIGEQAHLLQYFGPEVLRFIDDQDRAATQAVIVQQETVQGVGQRLYAVALLRQRNMQLFADRAQELDARQLRVQHDGNIGKLGQLLQQAAYQGRLAGTDFAGQLDKATAFPDTVDEMGERFRMPLAHIEVTRIRGDREWLLVQSKKTGVHPVRKPSGGARYG